MIIEGPLPEQSESQRIGHLAEKCFGANCPNEWRSKNLDGTDDFGFDYQVQTIIAGRATDVFRVQLKGKQEPEPNATDEFFSVTLKASTVRYYSRVTEPVLLVLADLSIKPERPADCPLFYNWVHDELRRLNEQGIPPEQKFVSLRVPLANRLTEATDLSSDLARFRQLAKVGEALDIVAERKHPALPPSTRANLIEKIPKVFERSSASLLQAMTEEPASAWPEAPKGSFPWYLQEAAQRLRIGADEEAEQSLVAADDVKDGASDLELAEYWYLVGRSRSIRLEDEPAREAYAKAATLAQDAPKYIVAWAEAELRLRLHLDEPNDFSDVIARLSSSDPLSMSMRARLLAAEGRYAEAVEEARLTPGSDGWSALAITHTMQLEHNLVIEACDSGLRELYLRDVTKQLFLIMRSRAYFSLAIGAAALDAPETYLPLSGPAGADIGLLRNAWEDMQAAVDSLRASGWPSNIEFLADIWAATASMLGRQDDILPVLTEAASARPVFPTLQFALESIAVQCGDFSLALTANARQPDSETKLLRRVALFNMAGRDSECVQLFEQINATATPSHPMFGTAISLAILSADRIVRSDLVTTWQRLLDPVPELVAQRALLDYLLDTARNMLAKDMALARLEAQYEALGRPVAIGIHLFHEFNATDPNQAEKCVAIAESLSSDRMLYAEAAIHLAQAFATLGHWPELLELATSALTRFENDERFIAIKAMALDRLGRSPEALASLKRLIGTGSSDTLALNTYINIVVRCGFTEEAISSVEAIVAAETDILKRIEALKLLFNLIHYSDPFSTRSVDIAWRMGQLTSQNDEAQEGLFLVLMLAATLYAKLPSSDSRLPEFRQRLETFAQRFPDSNILKSAHFPENANSDTLMRIIREITGMDDTQLRWREKMERLLQRGEMPIPYAWRPRHILGSVPDLPTLWEICKASKPHQRQFHLTMVPADWKPVNTSELSAHIPLLDLITLLIVRDLGIFELLFDIFSKIAVNQATLMEINQLIAPLSGSPFRQKCLELQAGLKARFEHIVQPWTPLPDEESFKASRWASEEIKELVANGSLMLYSDDAIFRIYCDPPASAPSSICSLDVLHALENKGLLSTIEVAEKIAMLCSWHVGLIIDLRYQVAILPSALSVAKSVSEGIDILHGSPLCSAVFDEIWDPRKPFDQLIRHGAALLREFVSESRNRIESIAALIGLWFGKARLHPEAPHPPVRVLAHLVMHAVARGNPLDRETVTRLWTVYRSLVEFEHGDHMDIAKERQAISLAGEIAAEIDQKGSLQANSSLRNRLARGLTDGTSDADAFSEGYNKFLTRLVEKSRRSTLK
ncbi:DUF4365 domain-containing protein [Methylocaldum sp.]|uniref:DUF4365 domain-containing protein n=1 Tax=Methylocaldum sp. TaxID=1969727 RepID=UPI002D65C8F9|nr:DUF4365 domain-containing protein [Methylocaldum sp.]HYE33826.1 DUF4365 domain-containing protein [Methylocaldum sp.]